MRYFLALQMVLLMTCLPVFSQTLEEKEIEMAAKNNIRTKIQIDYKYVNGKQSTTGLKSSTTTYNTDGKILEKNFFNNKNIVVGWEKYDYDGKGNRTLYERENTSSKYKKISKYNEHNDVVLEAGFNGAENFRNEYSYYAPGKPDEIVYQSGNRITQKLVYSHSGSTAILSVYTNGNNLTSKIMLVYDARGNIVEERTMSLEGKELERKTYKYNTASQILEEEKTRQGDFYYRLSYEYDSRGNLTTIYEETPSSKKYEKKVYVYDEQGNLTQYKWRRNDSQEFNVKSYTYNDKGICLTEHTFYPSTKYELLSKFEYEFY